MLYDYENDIEATETVDNSEVQKWLTAERICKTTNKIKKRKYVSLLTAIVMLVSSLTFINLGELVPHQQELPNDGWLKYDLFLFLYAMNTQYDYDQALKYISNKPAATEANTEYVKFVDKTIGASQQMKGSLPSLKAYWLSYFDDRKNLQTQPKTLHVNDPQRNEFQYSTFSHKKPIKICISSDIIPSRQEPVEVRYSSKKTDQIIASTTKKDRRDSLISLPDFDKINWNNVNLPKFPNIVKNTNINTSKQFNISLPTPIDSIQTKKRRKRKRISGKLEKLNKNIEKAKKKSEKKIKEKERKDFLESLKQKNRRFGKVIINVKDPTQLDLARVATLFTIYLLTKYYINIVRSYHNIKIGRDALFVNTKQMNFEMGATHTKNALEISDNEYSYIEDHDFEKCFDFVMKQHAGFLKIAKQKLDDANFLYYDSSEADISDEDEVSVGSKRKDGSIKLPEPKKQRIN